MSDSASPTLSDVKNSFRFQGPATGACPSAEPEPTAAPAAPRTPPARRSGRLLLAVLMFAACSAGIATVWDSLLRYRAYGVVTGRIVDVSAPIDGVLESVHVREGTTSARTRDWRSWPICSHNSNWSVWPMS